MIKYAGWALSVVLLILLIVTGYNTTARSNAQLKAQSDNFTANYNNLVIQNAQRDAQWQSKVDATIAERNATWNATLAATAAQRDASWNATMNAALASAIAERNATWNATMNTALNAVIAERNATWNATLTAALAANNAWWQAQGR